VTAAVAETAVSGRWDAQRADVCVIVSTFRRPHYLPGLLAALAAQDIAPERLEVVIVDNGSGDDTWAVLSRYVRETPLAMCAARLEENHGPAPGRSAAVAISRAPYLAFTDDDCMPEPSWARAILEHLQRGARVVQGRTEAVSGNRGPWDHTMTIRGITQWFETCNVGYRRDDVVEAGLFSALPAYRFNGKPFGGEDTILAWKILRSTAAPAVFADDAVVRHRIEPRGFRGWLKYRHGTSIFPALVRSIPEVRSAMFLRYFLTARTAAFDLATVCVVTALVLRSPLPLVGVLVYVRKVLPRRWRNLGYWAQHLAAVVIGDASAAAGLWRGSVRYRRVVL
jgi:glycosyltransferase involved in cell wall biosynthesis